MAEKKFYWLRLKRDFFKRHDIRVVEAMPNGKDYVLFYLKLMVESIDHNGELRFSDTIPYDENMLSVITNTNVDIVRAAMQLFKQLELVEILDDSTIFMREVQALTGSETKWAEKQRLYRQKRDNVPTLSEACLPNVRQEKEIEKEKDKESEKESISAPAELPAPAKETPVKHKYGEYGWVQLTDAQYARLLHDYGLEELNRCIKYVDESAQGNGNKNRWKDWNLIIRKCHTQQWGVQKGSWQRQMPGRTQASEDEVEALRRMHAHITGGGK